MHQFCIETVSRACKPVHASASERRLAAYRATCNFFVLVLAAKEFKFAIAIAKSEPPAVIDAARRLMTIDDDSSDAFSRSLLRRRSRERLSRALCFEFK